MSASLHKSCNKTVAKFYTSFDLLPIELKKILWEGVDPPTIEDVNAAWDIAVQEGLVRKESSPNYKKPYRKKVRKDKITRTDREMKRVSRYLKSKGLMCKQTFIAERFDKHSRLIRLFSDEEVNELIARRKKKTDVTGLTRKVVISRRLVKVKKSKSSPKYYEGENTQFAPKALDNSVGKKRSDIKILQNVNKVRMQ